MAPASPNGPPACSGDGRGRSLFVIAHIPVEDVDLTERTVAIRGKGAGGRLSSALPLSDETYRAMVAYLEAEGHRTGPLIRNRVRYDPRVAPSTISELVHQAMADAGILRPGMTPHSCRHHMAHAVLARTQNVWSVQKALRHQSIRSTEIYLRGATTELRTVMAGRSYLTEGEADELAASLVDVLVGPARPGNGRLGSASGVE